VRFRDTTRHATAAVVVTVRAAPVVPAGVCQATEAAPIGTRSSSTEAPSAAAVAISDVLLVSIAFSQPSNAIAVSYTSTSNEAVGSPARRLSPTTWPLVLYRGGRQAEDLYLPELARRWTRRLCNFSHVPVLSQADAGWEGLRGHVQDAALADFPDLTLVDLYASGSPAMVAEAREKALAHGLALDAFHADAFVAAG